MKISILLEHQPTGQIIELKHMDTKESRQRTIENFSIYSGIHVSGLHLLVEEELDEFEGLRKIGFIQDGDLTFTIPALSEKNTTSERGILKY